MMPADLKAEMLRLRRSLRTTRNSGKPGGRLGSFEIEVEIEDEFAPERWNGRVRFPVFGLIGMGGKISANRSA